MARSRGLSLFVGRKLDRFHKATKFGRLRLVQAGARPAGPGP